MDLIALFLSVASLIGLVLGGLFIRGYLPSYLSEKGKNLASKEDLEQLTDVVEKIKAQHASELERVKADHLSKNQVTERRRQVYEEMCEALRIFIAGHEVTPDKQERFHSAYSTAWLWASDDVIAALNKFVSLQIQVANNRASTERLDLHGSYSAIIVAMRKDVGFANTATSGADYQFVNFSNGQK